jgi:MFS family permease
MVISPFLGAFIGQLGRNVTFVLLAVLASWTSHALMAFTTLNPWYAMALLGVGYSVLACTVWPMISLVIPENQLGTAYGIAQALQNLGLGLIVYGAGYIVDSKGYFVLEIFFLAWLSR